MEIESGSFSLGVGVGSLLTVLIDKLVEHRLARNRDSENRIIEARNAACAEFQSAFLGILGEFRNEGWVAALFIRRHFQTHQAASLKFLLSLSGQRRADYQQAWDKYERFCAQTLETVLHTPASVAEERNELRRHIESLLSFAR